MFEYVTLCWSPNGNTFGSGCYCALKPYLAVGLDGWGLLSDYWPSQRILSWNCRSASRTPKIRALKALVRDERSHAAFIAESKVKVARIDKMRQSIAFLDSHCVSIVELNFLV